MRVFVHDFGGYAFPVTLSRALARRGHTVLHGYCASLQTTPRGGLEPQPDDPATLTIRGQHLQQPLDKAALVTRWRQENAYGRLAVAELSRFRPDVVLSGNTPLDAQRRLLRAARRQDVRFVFWVQDLIGEAAYRLLHTRLPVAGHAVGLYYRDLERRLLRRSDAVVAITDDFAPFLATAGVPEERQTVIENWAPLEEVPVHPKANAWAQAHGLAGRPVLLYSGTLAMKHNPDLLLQLALQLRAQPEAWVVVVSQGIGAEWLAARKAEHGLDNLVLLGYQPFEDVPQMLAAADVLLAVLEPDAGVFSVPSKVLTYLCAARPILLAVPPGNLAARIVRTHDAGPTVAPDDTAGFVAAAEALLADPDRRARHGQNARRYAEATFDIERITDRFEAVLTTCR